MKLKCPKCDGELQSYRAEKWLEFFMNIALAPFYAMGFRIFDKEIICRDCKAKLGIQAPFVLSLSLLILFWFLLVVTFSVIFKTQLHLVAKIVLFLIFLFLIEFIFQKIRYSISKVKVI